MNHELKIWTEYFPAVAAGLKPFEVRKDDRGFNVGDTLHLMEFNPHDGEYMDRSVIVKVTYVLRGGAFGVQEGFCVMGIEVTAVDWAIGKGIEPNPVRCNIPPLQLIDAIRESDEYIKTIYTMGSCYRFYQLLKSLYPDAKPLLTIDEQHVVTRIDGVKYDIGGVTNLPTKKLTGQIAKDAREWSFHANNMIKIYECPECEAPVTYEIAEAQAMAARIRRDFCAPNKE